MTIRTSCLLHHPAAPGADGAVHRITPEDAGWRYVGFEVFELRPDQAVSQRTDGRETCLVLVSGRAAVRAGDQDYGVIGGRANPFEGSPWSVYVPAGTPWSVQAEEGCELAVCSSPAEESCPRA